MKPTGINRQYQRGIGMTEVMVSLLLLGLSVIGFAALQVRAVAGTHDSLFRGQATAIAADLAERIRLNTPAMATYMGWNPGAATAGQCEANACTSTQLAQYDILSINQEAATLLPNGSVALRTCPGGTNSCVYVAWNNTTPTTAGGANDCVNTSNQYVSGADCVVVEMY